MARVLDEAEGRVRHVPIQPHSRMPEILGAADLVVLPQQDRRYTRAQVPGKLFEAMAMGKAIVASAVSDLPLILDGCGVLVPPGDQDAPDWAVAKLAADPDRIREPGRLAREWCCASYDWNAMERLLREVFAGLA